MEQSPYSGANIILDLGVIPAYGRLYAIEEDGENNGIQ